MIIKTLTFDPIHSNCYILGCPKSFEAAVIDPGGDGQTILEEAEAEGLTIKYVLNTHAHWDVTSGNADLVAATGAQLAIHRNDIAMLRTRADANLLRIIVKPSPEPDIVLQDGQVIRVGTLNLQVIHTPGHTSGHVSFYEADAGSIFTGDAFHKRDIGHHNMPGQDFEVMMHSVNDLLFMLPRRTTIYHSHWFPTTIGKERKAIQVEPESAEVEPSLVRRLLPELSLPKLSLPDLSWLRQYMWMGFVGGGMAILLFLLFLVLQSGIFVTSKSTVTPVATLYFPTATITNTPQPTGTATATATATDTATPTPTGTPRPTETSTPTPTTTATATAIPTVVPTRLIPTRTPAPVLFATPTPPPPPPPTQPPPPPPTQPPPPPPTQPPPPPPTQPPPPPPTEPPPPPPTQPPPMNTRPPVPTEPRPTVAP